MCGRLTAIHMSQPISQTSDGIFQQVSHRKHLSKSFCRVVEYCDFRDRSFQVQTKAFERDSDDVQSRLDLWTWFS